MVQDPSNLSLWRTLVRTSRNTMARCTAPGVLQLFSKAITRIGQLKLHRPTSTVEHDVLGQKKIIVATYLFSILEDRNRVFPKNRMDIVKPNV